MAQPTVAKQLFEAAKDDASVDGAGSSNGDCRHVSSHESVHFDTCLKPKSYHMKGTNPDSKILFRNVRILDSTGREPFLGDVYIQGEAHSSAV